MREQLVTSTAQTYGGVSKCTSITVHETANQSVGADAQAHANLQSSGNVRQASWHIQVDDTEAIRSYPDSAQCWHAGPAAADSIAVEICVNSDGDYDKAFARAAEVVAGLRAKHGIPRSKVYDHAHWTGKNCPSVMRATGRWQEFLNLTEGATPVTKFSSPLPVGTYRTDGFDGLGKGREHMGTDWAGPDVGDKTPVYAVADGTIEHVGGPSSGAVLAGHSGKIIVIDHGILKDANGSDRIRTNYGHLSKILVKKGQRVKAGDQIGITGDTGNVTGVHLHFGVRENGTGFGAYFDPEAWLKGKGITVGVTAPLTGGSKPPAAKPKPKPTTSKPSAGGSKVIKKQTNSTRPNGSTTFPTDYEDLKLDKDFGEFTIGALQILLHALKRKRNGRWDGEFANLTVMDFMDQLQAMGYYKTTPFAAKGVRKGVALKVDGGDGYWFWVAVQMMLKDRKFYTRAIDGDPKGFTVDGLQRWLNEQNGN